MLTPDIQAALHDQKVEHKLAELERKNIELRNRMDAWDADRQKLFVWGILALGAAVVALASYIWSHIPGAKS